MSAYWLNNTLHVANISSPTTLTTVDKDLKFDGDLFFQNHVPNVGDVLTFEGSWKPAVPAAGGTSCDTHNLKYLDATGAKGDVVEIVYNDNTVAGVKKTITNGAFTWANKSGGSGYDSANSVCTDSNGNSYIVGQFSGTALFGGTFTRISSNTSDPTAGYNTFVAKVNSSGVWQWVAQVTNGVNTDINTPITITCDCDGNSYIYGTATGASVLSFGAINLTSNSFLAKINTSGVWQWAIDRPMGGFGSLRDSAADCNGNVYVLGFFSGTQTFGAFTLSATDISIFVGKFDSNGTWLWVNQAGDDASMPYLTTQSIAIDCYGNSYVAGVFRGSMTVGNFLTENSGLNTIYIASLNESGVWKWGIKLSGTGTGIPGGICLDKDNNIYVSGGCAAVPGQFITIPTVTGNINVGSAQTFLGKFNNLQMWEWANTTTGAGLVPFTISSPVTDRNGDVYSIYTLWNNNSNGPFFIGPWSFTLSGSLGSQQRAVVVKNSKTGGWVWYVNNTGTNMLQMLKMGIDYDGNLYGVGWFNGSVTLGSTTLSTTTIWDIFVTRIHHSALSSKGLLNANTTAGNIVQVSIPGGSPVCDAFANALIPSYHYFIDCDGDFSTCEKCAIQHLGIATNPTTMISGL